MFPGTFYIWHLDDLAMNNYDSLLVTHPDNNTVWIDWSLLPAGTYQLTILLDNPHLCCKSSGVITIQSTGTFSAYYNQTICKGNPAFLSVFPLAGTFNWSVVPSTGVIPPSGTGSSFSPVFTISGDYITTVNETGGNYCNTTQQLKIKVINTPSAAAITGPTSGCPGSQYTYTMATPAPSGFYYNWQITGGSGTFEPGSMPTTTGNSAIIAWTALPGMISVTLQHNNPPACPSAAVFYPISLASVGNLTGPVTVCVDDSLT